MTHQAEHHSEHHRRALDALLAAGGDIGKIDTRNMITLIHADLQEIRSLQESQAKSLEKQAETLAAMNELLVAWDNIKSVRAVGKFIGVTIIFLSAVVGAIVGAWYAFKKALGVIP